MSSIYHNHESISDKRYISHRSTATTSRTTTFSHRPKPTFSADFNPNINKSSTPPLTSPLPALSHRAPIRTTTPSAQLISHSSAPLASRVSFPPRADLLLTTAQLPIFHGLSLEDQESLLIDDILFVLMGFEGQYIHFSQSYNPNEEKDRLIGPEFTTRPGLDPSLRDLATPLFETASQYIALEAFVEVQSRDEYGAVNHAFCATVRKFLKDYSTLIVQLENQRLTNPDFTLHALSLHAKPASHLLFQLYSVAIELLKANSILEDDVEDDSIDDSDHLDDIIESLREGGSAIPGKKTCKGGTVLGLITRRLSAMSGDPTAKKLLTALIREASKPYMKMLNEWIHHGCINDPHNEFLVKEQKSIRREKLDQDYTDEYWEKRYTIRDNLVPPQLESVRDKVLLAGKYLNVVRECGGVDVSQKDKDLPVTFEDPRFIENVNAAYAHANSSLLSLLLTTHALPARLRSLKHYFFLDRSDFFSHFLELSASELRKPARNANLGKLQTLLDIVLRQPGSVASEDPYKEDVKVLMNEHSLTDWLMKIVNVTGMDQDAATMASYLAPILPNSTAATGAPSQPSGVSSDKELIGFDALVLDYSMPFPLSLVVSRVTLTRYQLLFRYLLSLRHLETLLSTAWMEHSHSPSWKHRSSDRRIESWKRRAWTLRARMLVFVQQLLYYCTSEVIEPNWLSLMARLEGKPSVDANSTSNPVAQPSRSLSTDAGSSAAPLAPPRSPTEMSIDDPLNETGQTTSSEGPSRDQPSGAARLANSPFTTAKRTVDELMQDHVDFLATCLKECMLTNSKLLKINSKILTTCTMFANYTSSLSRYLAAADPDLAADPAATLAQPAAGKGGPDRPGSASANTQPPPYDPEKLKKLEDLLQRYEDNFSRHLKLLLEMLNYLAATETAVFLSLCARLSTAASEGPTVGVGARV